MIQLCILGIYLLGVLLVPIFDAVIGFGSVKTDWNSSSDEYGVCPIHVIMAFWFITIPIIILDNIVAKLNNIRENRLNKTCHIKK